MAVQIDNLKGLLGIRRMDRVLNTRIRELGGLREASYGASAMWRGIG